MEEASRTATGLLDGLPVLLELTDERLVVRVGEEAVPRHDIPFHRITDVEDRTGLMTGFVTVRVGEQALTFSRMPKAEVAPMAAALRHLVATARPTTDDPVAAAASGSPLADLERLARLREAGVLSAEEFAEAKRRLLDRL